MYKKLFLLVLVLLGTSFALTNISSLPFTISTPDTYVVTANLSNGSTGITIGSNDVILDCQGFTLTGNYTNATYGIVSTGFNNLAIRNCFIQQFGSALYLQAGNNTNITNNTFYNSSHTDVVWGDVFPMQNLTFTNNTVQLGFDNGLEDFGSNNTLLDSNIFSDHRAGHGTSRSFQFVRNNNNVTFSNNLIANSTNGMRFDNVNISNILVINNRILDIRTNGLNYQVGSGTYSNVTFNGNNFTNVGYPTSTTASADISLAAGSTPTIQCTETSFINNLVTLGKSFVYLGPLNSSQTISNIDAGGLLLCNADNVILNNVTLTSLSNNYAEFILTENLTFTNYTATNMRIAIRAGGLANSSISNITANGSTLVAFNFAGATNIGNNISQFVIRDTLVQGGISPGGSNNTFRHGIIANSSSASGGIGVTSTTLGTGVLFDNISFYNLPLGFLFSVPRVVEVTQNVLINSSAAGTKTYLLPNASVAFTNQVNKTSFDISDTVAASEAYSINPFTNPYGLPAGINQSFDGKMLNVSAINLNLAFTSFNMSWTQEELGLINENSISLYSNNGSGWILLNNSPDTTNNKISFPVAITAGQSQVFGLFANETNCPIILTPGVYDQSFNYTGDPNPTVSLATACVIINSSNVEFNCNGFSITGTSNPSSGGIQILAGSNNVTIRNCRVDSYNYDIFAASSNAHQFINNTLLGSGSQGIYLDTVNQALITNNTFTSTSLGLVLVFGNQLNTITNNVFTSNTVRAIELNGNSDVNTIANNSFLSNNIDLGVFSSGFNQILNNNFNLTGFIGIQGSSTTNNNISGNFFQTASQPVNFGSGSNSNTIHNNYFNVSTGTSVTITGTTSNNILNNTFDKSTGNAISLTTTSNTIIEDNFYVSGTLVSVSAIDSSFNMSQDHFANGGESIYLNNTGSPPPGSFTIILNEVIFDPASNNFTNYTNLSMVDTLTPLEAKVISWSNGSGTAPFNATSFRNKYIQIVSFGVPSSIDSLTWHWLDSELVGFNESRLFVSLYAGAWNSVNQTLVDPLNRITVTNQSSFNIFGLFESGNYSLPVNITINYTQSNPYSSYNISNGDIIVADTGSYEISYVSGTPALISADNVIEPLQIIAAFVAIIGIALIGFLLYRTFINNGNV